MSNKITEPQFQVLSDYLLHEGDTVCDQGDPYRGAFVWTDSLDTDSENVKFALIKEKKFESLDTAGAMVSETCMILSIPLILDYTGNIHVIAYPIEGGFIITFQWGGK